MPWNTAMNVPHAVGAINRVNNEGDRSPFRFPTTGRDSELAPANLMLQESLGRQFREIRRIT